MNHRFYRYIPEPTVPNLRLASWQLTSTAVAPPWKSDLYWGFIDTDSLKFLFEDTTVGADIDILKYTAYQEWTATAQLMLESGLPIEVPGARVLLQPVLPAVLKGAIVFGFFERYNPDQLIAMPQETK